MDLSIGDPMQDLCIQARAWADNSDVRVSVEKVQYPTGSNLRDLSVKGRGALDTIDEYLAATDNKHILAFDLPR